MPVAGPPRGESGSGIKAAEQHRRHVAARWSGRCGGKNV